MSASTPIDWISFGVTSWRWGLMTGRSAGVFIVFFPTVSLPQRPAMSLYKLSKAIAILHRLAPYMCGIQVKRLPSHGFSEDLPFECEHLNICMCPAFFRETCFDTGMIEKCHTIPAIFS